MSTTALVGSWHLRSAAVTSSDRLANAAFGLHAGGVRPEERPAAARGGPEWRPDPDPGGSARGGRAAPVAARAAAAGQRRNHLLHQRHDGRAEGRRAAPLGHGRQRRRHHVLLPARRGCAAPVRVATRSRMKSQRRVMGVRAWHRALAHVQREQLVIVGAVISSSVRMQECARARVQHISRHQELSTSQECTVQSCSRVHLVHSLTACWECRRPAHILPAARAHIRAQHADDRHPRRRQRRLLPRQCFGAARRCRGAEADHLHLCAAPLQPHLRQGTENGRGSKLAVWSSPAPRPGPRYIRAMVAHMLIRCGRVCR